MTIQSHRLASLDGILDKLQSPQRDAKEDGQEESIRRFLSDTQSKGAMKKDMDGGFLVYPTKHALRMTWIPLLGKLSIVKSHSWNASHMCILIFNGACVV